MNNVQLVHRRIFSWQYLLCLKYFIRVSLTSGCLVFCLLKISRSFKFTIFKWQWTTIFFKEEDEETVEDEDGEVEEEVVKEENEVQEEELYFS